MKFDDQTSKTAAYRIAPPRVFASLPLSRWPLSWHVVLALASLLAVGIGALWWERQSNARHAEALTQYRQIQAEFLRMQQVGTAVPVQARLPLAHATQLDDIVRDIGHFAADRTVRITSLKIEHVENVSGTDTAAQEPVQARLVLQAGGGYASLKSWLSELLARYPALALQSLSMHTTPNAQQQVEAAVSFVLFLKAS